VGATVAPSTEEFPEWFDWWWQAVVDCSGVLDLGQEERVQRVAQSVVQVIVTGYCPVEKGNRADTDLVMGRQRTVGSGIAVESGGYIVITLTSFAMPSESRSSCPDEAERWLRRSSASRQTSISRS